MASPSNLKVKRLVELDALPEGQAGNAWMYATAGNKDYKVNMEGFIGEAAELVLDEAEEYADNVGDSIREDLLDTDDTFGTDMVMYQLDATGSVPRTQRNKNEEIVSVKDFGATGDGVTDDTTAIMNALTYVTASNRGALLFPPGRYAVTSMVWTANGTNIVFDRAQLYGIASAPVDSLLRLHNFRHSTIRNIEIETDGTSATGAHLNYGCALQLTSDNGSSPTQFVTIDGINIRYFKAGIVHGALLGNPPQASYPQSEIFIRNYKVRGVMQLFYGNATNGYLTFSGCTFVRFRAESNAAWWDAAAAFNIRNDAGQVISIGDEFQVSESGGYNNYGKDIVIVGPVYEHGSIDYLTGDYSVCDNINGFYGNGSGLSAFTVEAGSTGRLLLQNFKQRRGTGAAAVATKCPHVDALDSPEYRVIYDNVRMEEFDINTVQLNGWLVRGGMTSINLLTIDNSSSSLGTWAINDWGNAIDNVDITGESCSTTLDNSAKGGWTATGTGITFQKYTASLPAEHDSAIRVVTSAATTPFLVSPNTTSGFTVKNAGQDRCLRMKFKKLATSNRIRIQMQWFNFAGTQIGSTITVFDMDNAQLDLNGLDDWSELNLPVHVPSGAHRGRVVFLPGSDTDFAFTGIGLI